MRRSARSSDGSSFGIGTMSQAGGLRRGVGVLTATAAVAMMGDPAAFRSGREFAAWLGLVPRHSGTGGRVRMLGISKRGDGTLLIHGARSVLTTSKSPPEWASCLAERRPANVAAVALANKWALLAHGTYRPNSSVSPVREDWHGDHLPPGGVTPRGAGTTKCDGEQVRPRSAKPEQKGKKPSGRMRRGRLIPSAQHQPASLVLPEHRIGRHREAGACGPTSGGLFGRTAYAHGSGCESLPDVEVEVRAGERVECSPYVPADGATT